MTSSANCGVVVWLVCVVRGVHNQQRVRVRKHLQRQRQSGMAGFKHSQWQGSDMAVVS